MRIVATTRPSRSDARESNHAYSVLGLSPTAAISPVTSYLVSRNTGPASCLISIAPNNPTASSTCGVKGRRFRRSCTIADGLAIGPPHGDGPRYQSRLPDRPGPIHEGTDDSIVPVW